MIRLTKVTKEYQSGLPILKETNLHVRRGDFVYLTGRSGAGKSTLLKMLTGSENPTVGEVVVAGMKVHELKRTDIPFFRRKIGVVFQEFKLLKRRTVFENVALVLDVIGRPSREIQQRVESILQKVGLLQFAHSLPCSLSGGEKQRVAIARAMVHDPWLLLADEPTGNLDGAMAREIMGLFDQANKGGTTILIATHDQHLLRYGGQSRRVLQVRGGQIEEWQPHSRFLVKSKQKAVKQLEER